MNKCGQFSCVYGEINEHSRDDVKSYTAAPFITKKQKDLDLISGTMNFSAFLLFV